MASVSIEPNLKKVVNNNWNWFDWKLIVANGYNGYNYNCRCQLAQLATAGWASKLQRRLQLFYQTRWPPASIYFKTLFQNSKLTMSSNSNIKSDNQIKSNLNQITNVHCTLALQCMGILDGISTPLTPAKEHRQTWIPSRNLQWTRSLAGRTHSSCWARDPVSDNLPVLQIFREGTHFRRQPLWSAGLSSRWDGLR